MASRRMISIKLISSARFLKMPPSTQNLYFHLNMNADDDGVVEGFSVMRLVGSNEDDLRILEAKGFVVILNDDLVTYVVDWLEHNNLRSDRKVDSSHQELLLKVVPNVELQVSTKKNDRKIVSNVPDKCQTSGRQMSEESPPRLGKVRLGQERSGQARQGEFKDNIDQPSSKTDDKERLNNSFESIWKLYPKKQGKDNSFKAYKKAIKDGISDQQIIQGIENYKKQIEIQRTETQFIKQGSTFFNQRCYLDEFVTTTKQKNDNDFSDWAKYAGG